MFQKDYLEMLRREAGRTSKVELIAVVFEFAEQYPDDHQQISIIIK